MHPVPSCNNALFHLYGHGYKYSKYLFKHRASDDDDDDDGSCTYESNSSSDSSSEVESGTDIRSDESFVSDDLTIRYILYMSTYTHVSVSDSSGLVYFTVGRVEFIQHLNNNRQENFWQNFWGLFKIISGLVHSVYSLEDGKLISFAPCT